MNKILCAVLAVGLLASCGSPEVADYSMADITVSGDFLFEGPNTLQGKPGTAIEEIASELAVKPDDLSAIYLKAATITFDAGDQRADVQSALLQVVSDELELVSVATKSPLPATDPVQLDASQEQDLLPYLKDPTATVVVDANLAADMDVLSASVSLEFSVEYKK